MSLAGCRCDICPLRGQKPVHIERKGTKALIVATAPKDADVDEGRPLVSADAGMELDRAMRKAGWQRREVSLTHVIACRPPGDDLKGLQKRIKRDNRKSKAKRGDDDYVYDPVECCSGRLRRELKDFPAVIPLGGHAAQACIPGKKSDKILGIRGHKHTNEATGQKIFPTLAPSFVKRVKKWIHVFERDLVQARAWFEGRDTWVPPVFVNALRDKATRKPLRDHRGNLKFFIPTLKQIRAYLQGTAKVWKGEAYRWIVYDLETDNLRDDGITNIRCIGLASPDHVMVIPFLSIDGVTRFYDRRTEALIIDEIKAVFTNEAIMKVGHNAGSFDRGMVEREWGFTPSPLTDSMLVHKSCDAEMPHSLDYVGAYYTSVHAWKEEKAHGLAVASDYELWEYCGYDCIVNARVMAPILATARERQQLTAKIPPVSQLSQHVSRDPCTRDHALQSIGVGMHQVGIFIDQKLRQEKENECIGHINKWRLRVGELLSENGIDGRMLAEAGVDAEVSSEEEAAILEALAEAEVEHGIDLSGFNPSSHVQVRALLFNVWDLPEPQGLGRKDLWTDTGEKRTGKAVIQAFMTDRRLAPRQRALMHAIFMFRRWSKRFGTEVRPSRYDPDWFRGKKKRARCDVWADGRTHSNWRAGGTLVGRYASNSPNSQNRSAWFKPCQAAEEGNVIVGADVDQFHLRIIAELWGVESLLAVFENPELDPHAVFSEVVLGDEFRNASGYRGYGLKPKEGIAVKMRDMNKTLRYSGAYNAKPPTIYRIMRALVDPDTGHLLMPGLTSEQVEVLHHKWMTAEPEWEQAWKRHIAEWKEQGYLESPILKRRRYFLDENENDVLNYPILSCEGDIFGEITQRVVDEIPFNGKYGPGLVAQVHDALYVECRAEHAETVQAIINKCMNVQIPGWKVPITGAADIGKNFKEVA